MGRRAGLVFFAFFLLSWTVFIAVSLPLRETAAPHRSAEGLIDVDPVLDLAEKKFKNEIKILSESFCAIRSIAAGVVTETRALTDYILLQNRKIPPSVAQEEAQAFIRYSRTYGIPLDLAVAVGNTESHFKPQALSSHGSAGVMQVTWKIHKDILIQNGIKSQDELLDPALGIKAGCVVMSGYIKTQKDLTSALGRYYGGSAQVYWGRVSKNLDRYRKYEEERLKSLTSKKSQ